MVSIPGTLGCTPSQHDIQQTFTIKPLCHRLREPILECGACVVKRGACRLPDGGARTGCIPAPPHLANKDRQTPNMEEREEEDLPRPRCSNIRLGLTPFALSHPSGSGTSYVPPNPFDSSDTDYIQPPPSIGDVQHTHVSTDEDHPNIRQLVTAITQMVSDELSMLYLEIEKDDEDDNEDGEDYDVSSEFDDDNNPNDEEDDISNPLNPLSSTTLNQWNEIHQGTHMLVQVHQNKHRNMTSKSISKLISHLVANDPEIPISNVIQEVQVLVQTCWVYKRAICWEIYSRKGVRQLGDNLFNFT
ncbi:hypothetical protein M9H77_18208 [Catharanthus roseus]|uniref:Uncharacterized protein n=1 Tax=Catharanthus roseus TaxID=4058 RepID=A0ACC0B6U8_CATRO|nr:hypothetical protein M9H77_18208 [Catharanthus roseus]